MTTTSTSTNVDTQIQIALEVLRIDETGKTKSEIAKEFGVSPRSVNRYATKYEEEALDLLNADEEQPEENIDLIAAFEKEKEELEEKIESANGNNQELDADDLDRYDEVVEALNETEQKTDDVVEDPKEDNTKVAVASNNQNDDNTGVGRGNFNIVNPSDETDRRGRRGRAADGIKTIKETVIDILQAHHDAGTLTKENRENVIADIVNATGHERKQASKYLSGYKNKVGGYNS